MNLKYRFAILFSFLVFIILMIAATGIYFLAEDFRKQDFAYRLKAIATDTYEQYIKTGASDNSVPFNTSLYSLDDQKVVIADSSGKVVYAYPTGTKLPFKPELLETAKSHGEASFKQDRNDGIVVFFIGRGEPYVVAVQAYDRFGIRKMKNLANNLAWVLLGGIVLSSLFAYFFVKQVMKPLIHLGQQMKSINQSNLTARVDVPLQNDEFSAIARNFNNMLNRLQKGFDMQKSFVQHASHELRTPLANMLTQTEAALNKNLPADDLKKVLLSLREDQVGMSDLVNSLLLLSQYEEATNFQQLVPVRIDEALYETIEKFKEHQQDAIIHFNFLTVPENSAFLTIMGNGSLIESGFRKLLKNAFQYSADNVVNISLKADETEIEVIFENKGNHLSVEEQEKLFVPFFRGDNSYNLKGTGLSLSIVKRIVALHNGSIAYTPATEGNRFVVKFRA